MCDLCKLLDVREEIEYLELPVAVVQDSNVDLGDMVAETPPCMAVLSVVTVSGNVADQPRLMAVLMYN